MLVSDESKALFDPLHAEVQIESEMRISFVSNYGTVTVSRSWVITWSLPNPLASASNVSIRR